MINRLSFRLALPVVVGALLVWGFLTVFVLGAISRFSHDRIEHDLQTTGREVAEILDDAYDHLLFTGKVEHSTEDRIARARAISRLEKLLRSHNTPGAVLDGSGEVLASFNVDTPAALSRLDLKPLIPTAVQMDTHRADAYLLEYPPWDLRVILMESGSDYDRLAGTVRGMYLSAGGLTALGLAVFLLYSHRSVSRPVSIIAAALKRGVRPHYQGIEEFASLSQSFRRMMDSLDERERQVRHGQTWYRQMYETAPVMLFSMDPAGRFSDVNQQLATLSGHSRTELSGRPVASLLSFDTAALAPLWTDTPLGLTRGSGITPASEVHGVAARMHTAAGETLDVLMDALRTVDPEGHRVALCVVRDVTTILRTERQLIAARDAAQEAYTAKSEFLANVSHEIRTPLNGVLGMLQLLGKTRLNERQNGYVHNALDCGRSLLGLLGDILDYSSLDAGRMTPAIEPFSPAELLEDLMALFAREARAKSVELSIAIDPALPQTLMGDGGRLRQVLFNLAGNALKFTNTGQVTLRVDMVQRDKKTGNSLLLFQVEDTGIGIHKDKLPTLFEPFIQADGSHSRRYQGAGLGLAIVKRMVAMWGGTLEIDSQPEMGTLVSFTFPAGIAPEGLQAPAHPVAHPAEHPPGGRVLLAEDDPINTVMTMDMLESLGYKATIVDNGRDALKALAQEEFDCLLMDIQMPEMDGIAATRAIRSAMDLGIKTRIPIIALTAHALPGDRERFLAAGMDEYLAKPVEYDDLAGVLARAMDKPWRQTLS